MRARRALVRSARLRPRAGAPGPLTRRLGLRARITLLFAASALLLCVALSSITYFTARSALINQAKSTIEQQAYQNATATKSYLNEGFSPTDILGFLPEGQSLLYVNKQWTAPSPNFGSEDLSASLRDQTITGVTGFEQVVALHGRIELAVGVPIVRGSQAYFGTFPLDQLGRTLRILLASLALAVVFTTAAGAVLGRWASKRALRPLQEVSAAALAIANGRLETRLVVDDVHDLAVLASSFNRMVDQVQQRIERDARFTSDVSHELRSPLTTLAAAFSVIDARRDELPPRSAQALELLGAEIRHFQQMVGDLLEISRLDAGVAEFKPDLVEAGELVRRAVRSWGKESVPVIVSLEVTHRLVTVDKRRFERVIANLLDNAQAYAGGATLVVAERRGESLRILVEDRGPGIAEDERQRIFERFARGGATAGQRGVSVGTGLGLALVAEHVKLHGGQVFVENRTGGGARFVVELPLASEDARGEDELAGDEPAPGGDPPTPPPPAGAVPGRGVAPEGPAGRAPSPAPDTGRPLGRTGPPAMSPGGPGPS